MAPLGPADASDLAVPQGRFQHDALKMDGFLLVPLQPKGGEILFGLGRGIFLDILHEVWATQGQATGAKENVTADRR